MQNLGFDFVDFEDIPDIATVQNLDFEIFDFVSSMFPVCLDPYLQ